MYKDNNLARFCVALDSDYRYLMNKLHQHPRIVETIFHSIENILLSSLTIQYIIKTHSFNLDYDIEDVEKWLDYFDEHLYPLMVADYINEEQKLGLKVVPDKCMRFLNNQNRKTPEFDDDKITKFINNLNIDPEIITKKTKELNSYKPSHHIRGHFFFSAVHCFIIERVGKIKKKKTNIEEDNFYTMAFPFCQQALSEIEIMQDLQQKSIAAANELVKLLISRKTNNE